jgi:uncharacterized membrane protein (DUF441 family)
VDLDDLRARVLVGVRELYLTVQAPRAQQRGVQCVSAVRRRDDLHAVVRGEPVKLVEQLEHRALHLAVAVGVAVEALGANGVDLVDEDDGGRFLLGQRKGVADQLGAVANEHLNQQRAR